MRARAAVPLRPRALALLLGLSSLLMVSACPAPGATYLVVRVVGSRPAPSEAEVATLSVTLGNEEWPAQTRRYDATVAPLPARLSAELPASFSGELRLDVVALDATGLPLRSGGKLVQIEPGQVNETEVVLGVADGGPPDGDVGRRPDGPAEMGPGDGPDGGDLGLDGDGPSAPDRLDAGDGADGPPVDAPDCGDTTQNPFNCGACGHACRGGACRDGLCQPVSLATGQARPFALTVDATHVYWTDVDDGTVKRVAVSGGGPEDVATLQAAPTGIAVDELGVYWLNYGDGTVMVSRAGGPAELVVDGPLDALALAHDGSALYWITEGSGGLLSSVPREGAATSDLLLMSLPGARDLALDDTHVYVSLSDADEIVRFRKDGTGQPEVLIDVQNDPTGIAVRDGQVYWCNRTSGTVRTIAVTGGPASTALATGQDRPFAVAVDASGLYWVNYGDGRVMQLAAGQTEARMVAQGALTARDVAVDEGAIYWITEGAQSDGTVMMVVKPAPGR